MLAPLAVAFRPEVHRLFCPMVSWIVCLGALLRRDLAPKYAHKVLQKLIGLLWHSRATGVSDAEGLFRFRGFFGDYRVAASIGEPAALVNTFSFRRDPGALARRTAQVAGLRRPTPDG